MVLRTNQTLSHSLKVIKISVGEASHIELQVYAQIAAKKGPNSLYCLGAPLTTYIQSSWKEATMWFPNSQITISVSSLITLLLLQLWSFPLLSTPRPPGESSFIFSLTRSTNAAMKSWFARQRQESLLRFRYLRISNCLMLLMFLSSRSYKKLIRISIISLLTMIMDADKANSETPNIS